GSNQVVSREVHVSPAPPVCVENSNRPRAGEIVRRSGGVRPTSEVAWLLEARPAYSARDRPAAVLAGDADCVRFETMLDREERQLEAVRDPQLAEDVGEVMLDRLHADRKLLSDLGVGVSTKYREHDLELARREAERAAARIGHRRRRAHPHLLEHLAHALAPDPVLSRHHRTNAVEQEA